MSQNKIVWIASYPKSGNTWFRAFLSSLLVYKEKEIDINHLGFSGIASNRSLFDSYSPFDSSDLTREEIDMVRPRIYRHMAECSKENLYVKVHDAWRKNSEGIPVFPREVTGAVIYIVRDPLDVAVSFSFHLNTSVGKTLSIMNREDFSFFSDVNRIGIQFRQVLHSWKGHVQSWVDHSGLPVHVVRYEDLHLRPRETFSKALSFLGLHPSPGEINRAIKQSSFGKLQEKEKKEGFREKPVHAKAFFREGKAGNWKKYFSVNDRNLFVKENRLVMQRFCYVDMDC